jgi:hypothetical protein
MHSANGCPPARRNRDRLAVHDRSTWALAQGVRSVKRFALLAVGAAVVAALALFVWWPWKGDSSTRPAEDAPTDAFATPVAAESTGVAGDATSGEAVERATTVAVEATPTQLGAQGVDARRAAEVGDLVVVVQSNGAPLSGARAIVSGVLHDPAWDSTSEPHSFEREQVRGAVMPFEALATFETGRDGTCTIERELLVGVGGVVVIGVVHERALAEVRALEVADVAAVERVEFDLVAAAPVTARVTGAPAGGNVVVTQAALYDDFRLIDDYTNAWVSRPMLRFEHERVGDGEVVLFPVGGRNLVVARSGERVSAPFVGVLEGAIDVELVEHFTVDGRVEGLDRALSEAVVRLQALDAEGAWLERGVGAVRTDGTFDGIEVAWLEGARGWRARLEACDYVTLEAAIEPRPLSQVEVVFETPLVVRCDVRVQDGSTGEYLSGAKVTLDWPGRSDAPWSEFTGDDGLAMFAHLPAAQRIGIDVELEGYGPEPTWYVSADVQAGPRAWLAPIWPSCRVTARIAEPLTGNEKFRGEQKRLDPRPSSFRFFECEAVDGELVFDGVGGERVNVFLECERGTIGPFDMAQGAGVIDLGTVELVPFATARVRVLDAASGEPLQDARVTARMWAGPHGYVLLPNGARSGDDGSAEFARFPSQGAKIVVEKDGWSKVWVDAPAFDGAVFDFGEVALERERVLDVELAGTQRRLSMFAIEQEEFTEELVRFDPAGRASLPVTEDAWRFVLWDHSGRSERLALSGSVEALGRPFVWQVPDGRLEIEVTGYDANDAAHTFTHSLEIAWRTPEGWYTRDVRVSPRDGVPATRRVPAESVAWRMNDGAGRLAAWGRATLAPAGDQKLVVDLGGDVATLRVLDEARAPIAGAFVRGFDRNASSANAANYLDGVDTDVRGEAVIPIREGLELGIALLGPNDEIVPDVDTSEWRAGGVYEVTLAPAGVLDLVVVDATGSAVAGADLELRRGDDRMRLAEWSTSGDGRAPRVRIEPAAYLVNVSKSGHWSRRHTFAIEGDGTAPIEVLLPELAHLELRLVDASGAPLANTQVELLHEALDEFHSEWLAAGRVSAAAVTDVAGRLALDGVPAGTYVVGVGGYEVGTAATREAVTTVVAR